MARAMIERGHQAMVFVGGDGPGDRSNLRRQDVPFLSLRFLVRSIRPVRDLRAIAELTGTIRGFRPDIVSLHTSKAGWVGRIVASHLGVPALVTPHGWAFGERFPLATRYVFRYIEKAVSRYATAILCVCEQEKNLAVRLGVAEPGRLRVVYNGVHDIAAPLRADPGKDPARIVSVARFQGPKDHATLLHALAALRDRPWELDLVGDGPMDGELRRLAEPGNCRPRPLSSATGRTRRRSWRRRRSSFCPRARRPSRAASWKPCVPVCRWWLACGRCRGGNPRRGGRASGSPRRS